MSHKGESPSLTATLSYEPPDRDLRARETAAVWRVAWWIGLLWAIGQLMSLGLTAGMILVEGLAAVSWGARQHAPFHATSIVLFFFAALALLLGLVVRPAHRLLIAWLATAAWLCLVTASASSIALSEVGINGAGIVSIPSAVALVLWPVFRGAVVVLAVVAWRGQRTTVSGLLLPLACVLIADPIAAAFDVAYWVTQGEPLAQQMAAAMTVPNLLWNLSSALYLAAAILLMAMSGRIGWRRWPCLTAAVLVVFAETVGFGWSVHVTVVQAGQSPDVQFIARNLGSFLVRAAPGLALLAWRPPRTIDV